VLVIDEHSVYRSGLRDVIEARVAQCRVIEASTLEYLAGNDGFDLVLIDSDSLERSSVDRLRQVRAFSPRTSFALMSISHTRSDVLSCLSAGFHGFINKLDSDEELLVAINDLLSGRMYVPRWLADDAEHPEALVAQCDMPKLTRRQNEILPLLAQGMSNKEIAKHLSIAPGTTKIHTAALLRALRAHNRTEAAFIAAKLVRSRSSTGWYGTSVAQASKSPSSDLESEPAALTGSPPHIISPGDCPACAPEEGCANNLAAAIPWLRCQDWSRWQEIDPALGDYDRWLKRTSEMIAQAESVGITVEAVTLDPEMFLEWCVRTNHQSGSRGRSAYVAAQLLNKGASTGPTSRLS
jgi:DNA-binding NarL/FixJ family response regulator